MHVTERLTDPRRNEIRLMQYLLLLQEGRPGAMLLITQQTLSAIAAARLLQRNAVSAAPVGGAEWRSVPRRDAFAA